MMGNWYGSMMGGGNQWGLLALVTWLVVLAFLILGSVYFWKEINKK